MLQRAISAANLRAEGVADADIIETGNTGIDALLTVASQDHDLVDADVTKILKETGRVILVTAHRRENWGQPLIRIAQAVKALVEKYPDTVAVLPYAPQSRSPRSAAAGAGGKSACVPDRVTAGLRALRETAAEVNHYPDRTLAVSMEEAPSLGKPVLVLRETTERPEGVAAGVALLVGTDTNRIAGRKLPVCWTVRKPTRECPAPFRLMEMVKFPSALPIPCSNSLTSRAITSIKGDRFS